MNKNKMVELVGYSFVSVFGVFTVWYIYTAISILGHCCLHWW